MLEKEKVEKAVATLEGIVEKTPIQISTRLSEKYDCNVFFKREDIQKCRSFKVRGAYNSASQLSEAEKQAGVVCASAGNHAQGIAYACSKLGIKGTIFLPSNTPKQKRRRISSIGGKWVEPIVVDGNFDLANKSAFEKAESEGMIYVHPYDSEKTIYGQATIGYEIDKYFSEDIETVLIPAGGGGLLSGIAFWIKNNRPNTRVVAVEPQGAACVKKAIEAGQPVQLDKVDTFVDGTAVGKVGKIPFEIIKEYVDEFVAVPEGAVCAEMLEMYQTDGIIAEPAGALASAAIPFLKNKPKGNVICIVSGGNNDLSRYAEIMERAAVYEGYRRYFLVSFPQQPGALRLFLEDVLQAGEDIVYFQYIKKNNRENGPALVGLDLQDPQDISSLRKRMQESILHIEELNQDSEILRMLI
ncbi:threonine ammonia-lyase IlvA [Actinomyces sp. zg-332]|uniref:threonine ammonia-lyase IlvA n=1 Tax=Actinomyces sp. zg-332 TaxID=2708340 RepID=UPI00142396F3|nr:threonine ammonia-lyase IlvA [Actinomyces sp. zg-332]QPK93656.1 threonine ammonia-lyase IlvA [Actinomyces sp. zg-332]